MNTVAMVVQNCNELGGKIQNYTEICVIFNFYIKSDPHLVLMSPQFSNYYLKKCHPPTNTYSSAVCGNLSCSCSPEAVSIETSFLSNVYLQLDFSVFTPNQQHNFKKEANQEE